MNDDMKRIVKENLELALQALEMGDLERSARLAYSAALTIIHRNDSNSATIVTGAFIASRYDDLMKRLG